MLTFTLGAVLAAQDPDQEPAATLDQQQVTSRLAEARARLEGLPQGPTPESPDGLLRQAWERRVTLLEEAGSLLERLAVEPPSDAEIEERRRAVAQALAEHEALPAPDAPETPTEDGFQELETRVGEQRDRVTALRATEAERARYVEEIPALLAQAKERQQSALERSPRLNQEAAAASDPAQKELLQVRAENAALDAETAGLRFRELERDRDQEKILAPFRVDERELAERRLQRLEEEYSLYSRALEAAIDRETLQLEQAIERLESELASATGPAERFVAAKRLETATFDKNRREHGRFLLSLRTDLDEQQRRLTAEADELTSLREYLEKAGAGQSAGDRIKFTMQRVKMRRRALERTFRRDVAAELGVYRSRRFELEDKLFVLRDAWDQQVETTAAALDESAARSFRVAAKGLFEPHRTALLAERDVLTDVIGAGQELQIALIERRDALEALESFIRSKVFWIRDAKPLGPELWPRIEQEGTVVTGWMREVGSRQTVDRLLDGAKRPSALATLVLLLLVLPIGLFWVRQRLRRIVTRMNDRTLRTDAGIRDRLVAAGTSVVSVAVLPAYVLIASRMVDVAGLPGTLAPVLAELLEHLAIFLFVLFLSRSFFAGRGTAQVQFGMDRDAAHDLHRSLRIVLFAYLAFYSLRSILSRPPFLLDAVPLETLPRLAYTLFAVCAAVAGILLLQPRSAFSRFFGSALGDNVLGRRWPILAVLICVAGVGFVAMDIAGYRYGSGVLARNLVRSLVALLLLVPLYKGSVTMLESFVRRRRASQSPAAGEASAEGAGEPRAPQAPASGSATAGGVPEPAGGQETQVRKFLLVFFVIAGVVLIAGLWGIDRQAFDTLDNLPAYDIRDTGEIDEYVSWGDIFRTILYALGTFFLLKYLPGIYEYAIFPRLGFDAGLKYAILTISRYGVFTVGAILSLAELHLDLGRLGWLMAAIGVGLGFGLQEIVSNFVSGIILLVERPVRVGDVVTVGTTSGKVARINIRATTVVNFDRQEIIVPNRSLITKEVTNWTRGDTIIRLVVPIGVAYGSDVDEVTRLLLDIARDQPEILTDPGPQALFLTHGESSLDFELRVFIPDPSVKMSLQHRLNRDINRKLAERGIEIPFPQRDLHIRSSTVRLSGRDTSEAGV